MQYELDFIIETCFKVENRSQVAFRTTRTCILSVVHIRDGWMDGWMDGWIDGWIDRY